MIPLICFVLLTGKLMMTLQAINNFTADKFYCIIVVQVKKYIC